MCKKMGAGITGLLLATLLLAGNAHALELNGVGVYAKTYVGALWVGWPADNAAAIRSMPGRKYMALHVSAAALPRAELVRQWNRLIAANNSVADINNAALDIMAFLDSLRVDLVRGDRLVIELASDGSSRVFLNGVHLLSTGSPALFDILVNSWIGEQPPAAAFRDGLLGVGTDSKAAQLALIKPLQPSAERRHQVALAIKGPAPVAAVPPAAAQTAPKPAAAAKPATKKPVAVATPPQAAPEPAQNPSAPLKTETPVAATPASASAEAPTPAPADAEAAPVAAAPAPAPAALPAINPRQQQMRADYLRFIRERITRNANYPRQAVRAGLEGLVIVRLTLDRQGHIASLALDSSGQRTLDAAAEQAARDAAPFPPPDPELAGDQFETAIPVVFKLQPRAGADNRPRQSKET